MSARLLGLGFGCDMGTPCRKLVLLKLIDACEDDGTRIFPAVATIARAAQCSARQVQRELSRFVEVGLLAIVREGGMGPGSTREYRMNVAMLRSIEAEGWDAVTTGVEGPKGDTVSPLDDEGKGDTGDTERVTPATKKGDTACHPTPPDPSYYPSTGRAEAREREGEIGDRKKIEAAGWRLLSRWPGFAGMPKEAAMRAWLAMSDEDRALAERRFDSWLALLKAQGKSFTPAPSTYFRERLFADVVDPQAAPPGPIAAKPFGKAFGAYRMAKLLGGREPGAVIPGLTTMERRLVEAGEADEAALMADKVRRFGFPTVNRLQEAAADWRSVTLPAEWHAHGDLTEAVRVGSERWQAWEAEHEARGWPWLPDPGRQEWVYFPAGGPDGLEAFEAAIRGQADDGGGREAAE